MAACGMSDWPGLGTEPGDPRRDWGCWPQLPVLFLTYSSGSKTTPPTCGEAALHFSPLGYHSKEEISAWEESFGQVQSEGLGNGKSFETSLGW